MERTGRGAADAVCDVPMFGPSWRWMFLVCGVASCSTSDPAASPPASDAATDPHAPGDGGSEEEEGFDGATTPACILAEGTQPVAGDVVDATGTASAAVASGDACARTFAIASDAPRRDDDPKSPRQVAESADRPSLQTRNTMFDALYQLALDELGQASVSEIKDYAFRNGAPLACPLGCFETGKKWPYVWTRDTAYAAHLGLAWTDPSRARGSLELKVSARRAGGDVQIVQDTGTGGSYPVSSDRVVWALGAREVARQLEGNARAAFIALARDAIVNTVAHDRAVVFDAVDGLYRGEQSFLDWRSQSYPGWTVPDLVNIATSKSLSTNVGHLAAMETGAELAEASGDTTTSARLRADAKALRERIRARFWLAEDGQFSSFIANELDPAPVRRFDLLATSLAILLDVATPEQAKAAIASYPLLPAGPPVLAPQQQDTAIYHNRGIWPFVTAYFTAAARKAGNGKAVAAGVSSLVRSSALNLSNVENLELATGKPWVDEGGPTSGPVVNSQRQLWSVAGYVHMVHGVLFGLSPTYAGLDVAPFVPRAVRADLFGAADTVVLNNVALRGKRVSVVLKLPPATASRDGAYTVARVKLNGRTMSDGRLPEAELASRNLVEVELRDDAAASSDALAVVTNPSDYRSIFGPRTPSITNVSVDGAGLAVDIDRGAETSDAVTIDVYRDGSRVASNLPGTTTRWVDGAAAGDAAKSHCYTVETRFASSGNASQHARPVCFWGSSSQRIQSVEAGAFEATGGSTVTNGRTYRAYWGDPGHTLLATFTAQRSGPHLVQAVYSNGHGPLDTGITCAVKRLDVREAPADTAVGSGYLVMPQRGGWGDWGDSSTVRVSLVAGKTYKVLLSHDQRAVNMSAFQHFADYTGGSGGSSGATFRVDVAAIKLLALEP